MTGVGFLVVETPVVPVIQHQHVIQVIWRRNSTTAVAVSEGLR
jgi:hypothetical protein